MSEVVKQYTIKGALGIAAASLIYMLYDKITPERLDIAVVVGSYTLLAWLFGWGMTERYKRQRYEPDEWNAPKVKSDLWLKATSFSAAPLVALLGLHFPGYSPLKVTLFVIYGVGMGLMLPTLRNLLVDHLWPLAKRSFRNLKGGGDAG